MSCADNPFKENLDWLVVTIEFFSVYSALPLGAYLCVQPWYTDSVLSHTSNIINSSSHAAVCLTQKSSCRLEGFCLFLDMFFCLYLFGALSLSHCFIVCRLEGIGLILITHSNTLTSPLLSLHWSLVPKPLTSYWQGAPNSASVCVCTRVRACVEVS